MMIKSIKQRENSTTFKYYKLNIKSKLSSEKNEQKRRKVVTLKYES